MSIETKLCLMPIDFVYFCILSMKSSKKAWKNYLKTQSNFQSL